MGVGVIGDLAAGNSVEDGGPGLQITRSLNHKGSAFAQLCLELKRAIGQAIRISESRRHDDRALPAAEERPFYRYSLE